MLSLRMLITMLSEMVLFIQRAASGEVKTKFMLPVICSIALFVFTISQIYRNVDDRVEQIILTILTVIFWLIVIYFSKRLEETDAALNRHAKHLIAQCKTPGKRYYFDSYKIIKGPLPNAKLTQK